MVLLFFLINESKASCLTRSKPKANMQEREREREKNGHTFILVIRFINLIKIIKDFFVRI